jgi:hypothetical protein
MLRYYFCLLLRPGELVRNIYKKILNPVLIEIASQSGYAAVTSIVLDQWEPPGCLDAPLMVKSFLVTKDS